MTIKEIEEKIIDLKVSNEENERKIKELTKELEIRQGKPDNYVGKFIVFRDYVYTHYLHVSEQDEGLGFIKLSGFMLSKCTMKKASLSYKQIQEYGSLSIYYSRLKDVKEITSEEFSNAIQSFISTLIKKNELLKCNTHN